METKQPEIPGSPTRWQVFLRRAASASLLWGALLAALFYPDPRLAGGVFLLLMILLNYSGLSEFYTLMSRAGHHAYRSPGQACVLLLTLGVFYFTAYRDKPGDALAFEVLWVAVSTLLIFLAHLSNPPREGSISATVLGLIYVGLMLGFIQHIRFYNADGPWYLLLFILVTKMSDTGAYVVGSLWGRHKMVPAISPGKTWEGFAGAIVFSITAAWLVTALAPAHFQPVTRLHVMLLGALLGLGAVMGDLVESKLKREAGMKDSGSSFPGIGGILDLLDSLLFNAPLMYLYLRLFVHGP